MRTFEGINIRPDHPAAVTLRNACRMKDRFAGIISVALCAVTVPQRTVNLKYIFGSRLLMQAVDVLVDVKKYTLLPLCRQRFLDRLIGFAVSLFVKGGDDFYAVLFHQPVCRPAERIRMAFLIAADGSTL